jgi:ABC-type nitrate/sulfonate/bicarbonate transport system substrate-binding protein
LKIILLLLSTFFTLNLYALEEVKLQLKWKNQFQSAGFIVAKEKGFYSDVGLDVNILEYNNNIHIMDDLETEKIHFAVSDSASILNRMNGAKIKALLVILKKSPYILGSSKL